MSDLDKLSIIHVAGTKGKGSTCAFCDSILREYGYRTGFYSSPHLVAVRERIRLNGKPIAKDVFAKYFFQVYKQLMHNREHQNDMPAYFRLLTILAFNIFLQEKVDVVILEVGIGGEFDCTNLVRNTRVVGITHLGLDHTILLGNTLEQIAWQKAGIMKNKSQAFTVPQLSDAMKVLHERSIEKESSLNLIPNFNEYEWHDKPPALGISGEVQKTNASLAIQLSHTWLKFNGNDDTLLENKLHVPENTVRGLKNCKWPGRCQVLRVLNQTFFLDGAHTEDSLKICANWFKDKSSENSHKVLIFNATGNRDSELLLTQLNTIHFNIVCFVPNTSSINNALNLVNTIENQLNRCESHKKIWLNIYKKQNQIVATYPSVKDAIDNLPVNIPSEILVTGSLHLIGAALELLDPELRTF